MRCVARKAHRTWLCCERARRMARGNKRDVDRARAAARNAKGKGKSATELDGLTKAQRQQRDADALKAKVAAKQAAKAAAAK